ncbi:MAG: hypothetical protein ACOY3P_20655 [Planctomycetota bacterium]
MNANSSQPTSVPSTAGRLSFLVALLIVLGCAASLLTFKLGEWSWDKDEVASLVELGVRENEFARGKLASQIERLPRLLPVWYGAQRVVLRFLPPDEFGARLLQAICGVVTVGLAFSLGWAWRGGRFAVALAILLGMNQTFVWLVQQNRFYSMALMFTVMALGAIWWQTRKHVVALVACAILSALAVLSHNLLTVVFGIGFIAAILCFIVGAVPWYVLARTATTAAVGFGIHFLYLRPLMSGWISGGTGETSELVSFAAQLGIPTAALAALGIGLSLRGGLRQADLLWWTATLIGGVCFIGLSPWLIGNWNARYALLFMPSFWVLAAYGVEQVANALPSSWGRFVWYTCVVLLLLPKLASHYLDGTRHDFRAAGQWVAENARVGEAVFCDFPMELDYYIRQYRSLKPAFWNPQGELPEQGFLVVLASNAYQPPLRLRQRSVTLLEDFFVRRFDEQSHVIRIYRVLPRRIPGGSNPNGAPPETRRRARGAGEDAT